MNQHIETLRQYAGFNMHCPCRDCKDASHDWMPADLVSALTAVINLLDPAKAEGHAKVLLDYAQVSDTYQQDGHWASVGQACRAGDLALQRVPALEAELAAAKKQANALRESRDEWSEKHCQLNENYDFAIAHHVKERDALRDEVERLREALDGLVTNEDHAVSAGIPRGYQPGSTTWELWEAARAALESAP